MLDYNGEPLKNVNSMTLLLNSIFEKNIGSSMLRHIYLSDRFGDYLPKLKEMQEVSKKMSHSSNMQQEYIKKD